MDSIDKAREAICKDSFANANLIEAFGAAPDALIAETLEAVLDAIESELAERYMLLPLDAYGASIHPDDLMSCTAFDMNAFDGKEHVMAIGNGFWMDKDGWTHIPSETLHVKPRTVEDVLRDGIRRTATESQIVGIEMAICSVVPDLVNEIRELMGVDE